MIRPGAWPGPVQDPLSMALNAAAFVDRVAERQHGDDDTQMQSYINREGKQAMDTAIIAGMMALVSMAADVRRLADANGTPRTPR